jgi:hypothetical protein
MTVKLEGRSSEFVATASLRLSVEKLVRLPVAVKICMSRARIRPINNDKGRRS